MNPWAWLMVAIGAEVIGTSALKAASTMPKAWALVVMGYGLSFACLAQALEQIPIGVAYAVWSGLGMAALVVIGWFLYGQRPDLAGWLGMGLILSGVVVLRLFSNSEIS